MTATASKDLTTYSDFNTNENMLELPYKDDCYHYHVETFRRWMRETGNTDPLSCVPDYFRDLNQSNYAAGTVRMKRQAVINRLRLMSDAAGLSMEQQFQLDRVLKRLNTDPETKAPKTASTAIGASKVCTEPEYARLIEGCRSRKQQLFIRFFWDTGCRVSELTGAEIRNCKRQGAVVEIRVMGKGRKERVVKITGALFDAIAEEFGGQQFLFETGGGKPYRRSYVSNQIAKITQHVLGKKLSAHKFRHSFATRQIAKSGKIAAVSSYLGHASVSTTMSFYVHEELTDADLFGIEAVANA